MMADFYVRHHFLHLEEESEGEGSEKEFVSNDHKMTDILSMKKRQRQIKADDLCQWQHRKAQL